MSVPVGLAPAAIPPHLVAQCPLHIAAIRTYDKNERPPVELLRNYNAMAQFQFSLFTRWETPGWPLTRRSVPHDGTDDRSKPLSNRARS
jgi:hypothetical protein